jgi:hypothetical protein
MPAMNGFAVSFRSRGRLIGCCMALVLLVAAVAASSASAAKPILTPTYDVTIGDSLGFGYTAQKFEESIEKGQPGNPSLFEGGYANLLEKKIAGKEKKAGNAQTLVNLSCPGEITGGMIGHNAALGGFTYTPKEGESEAEVKRNELRQKEFNPCAWHNEAGLPYHFDFGSGSQLEGLVGLLTTPGSPKVTNLTVNMGSNDELKVVSLCENPSYDAEQGFASFVTCLKTEAGPSGHFYPGGEFGYIIHQIGDVVGVARHFGYTGPVEILGYYNPDALVLAGSDSLQKALNEAFECAVASKATGCTVEPKPKEKVHVEGSEAFGPGVAYGNPFAKINPQNKNESAHICEYTEMCNEHDKEVKGEGDIHPTPAGYKVLAAALYKAYKTL